MDAPRRRRATRVGDLLPRALRSLGIPSQRLTARLRQAWQQAGDPAWQAQAEPLRLEGGVLEIGVSSSALRQELQQFHQVRLLEVLRTALPDVTLVALRFVTTESGGDRG